METDFASVEARVRPLVALAVSRKLTMFAAFRDIDGESLEADMLGEVARAWPGYKPGKSKPTTFAYGVASRKLIDLWRVRSRELNRINGVAERTPAYAEAPADDDLPGELQAVYQRARDTFTRYGVPLHHPKANAGTIDRAQATAIAWLQRKLGLSVRTTAIRLLASPELCRAIKLGYPPSYRAICRANAAVTRINFSSKSSRITLN